MSDLPDPTVEQLLQHEQDTRQHIEQVSVYLQGCINDLQTRQHLHDQSKLQPPEAPAFAALNGELEDTEYGSDEYEALLEKLRGGPLEHHYENNDHHPEHFEDGIGDMNLLQITEMLCDWAAAVQRHDDDRDLHDSIEQNQSRFGYSDDLKAVLHNTANYFFQDPEANGYRTD